MQSPYFCNLITNIANFTVINVTDYEKHPNYNSIQQGPNNDIAIITVNRITESNFVPICLTDDYKFLLGFKFKVITWSLVNETLSLQSTEVTIVGNGYCNQNVFKIEPENSFCGLQGLNGAIFCTGDSGGGLIQRYKMRWYLRGIVSYGKVDKTTKDCTVEDFVIFTNVTNYIVFLRVEPFRVKSK